MRGRSGRKGRLTPDPALWCFGANKFATTPATSTNRQTLPVWSGRDEFPYLRVATGLSDDARALDLAALIQLAAGAAHCVLLDACRLRD